VGLSPEGDETHQNLMLNRKDLEDLIKTDMDEGAKRAFLSMTREEQLLAILGMQSYIRAKVSTIEKRQIDFEDELRIYRIERESKERKQRDDVLSTTQKVIREITKAMDARFNWGVYFRDKVLPQVIIVIVLGMLYLVFGRGMP